MSQADYKYGPHRGHLHSLPLAENSVKTLIRTFSDSDRLDMKWLPLQSDLCSISKFKLVSLLFALTLTFIIGASYVLTGDRDGFLFIPPPYQIFTSPMNSSDEQRLLDLVNLIESKLEYPPRSVPAENEVIRNDTQLFALLPRQFLPGVKSPCWYENMSTQSTAELYKTNHYYHKAVFKTAIEHLRRRFRHVYKQRGNQCRLRCLPYFYIIGQPKCGTTDLFYRLLMHPEVKFNIMKEPHWWSRRRFGDVRLKDGFRGKFPLEDYLDLFDSAAFKIQEGKSGNSTGDLSTQQIITGEASASTMWDNKGWSFLHGDNGDPPPPVLVQDFIHAVQPGAKIIIMLRDPVERLYSDYLYFSTFNKSAENFHQRVTESIQLFQSCLSERSLRSCVYNTTLSRMMAVRLHLGMYVVYLLDWLTVFHREQILVVRLEDYAAGFKKSIKKVFNFLTLGPLSELEEAALTKQGMYNSRREKDKNLGPMLPTTRTFLREYYKPFNQKLAHVLDDVAFLWSDT